MQVAERWQSSYGSSPIWDLALEPGSQRRLALGCGSTLYIVNAANGEIESKYPSFHTDEIYTVAWTKDADDQDVIASAGADKHVIIWDMEDDKLKPRVKYPHNSTVQKAKFSPLGNARLVSVATTDFGLFSPDSKDVSKTSFSSRITDIAWAPLGDKFVIVSQAGAISVRNAESGSELGKFKRDSEIWSVDWLPVEGSKKTHIVVYDWAPSVTIYDHAGTVISPSRQIDFDPCCSSPLSKMPYQCVGGSEGSLALLSRDGIKLSKLDAHDSPFVWATQVRQIAGKQEILSSDHRGRVKCQTINFNRVHGLHKSLYATRDNLTDVLVEQLDDPQVGKLRVKCREIISLVAVYVTVLAVQCRSRMKIFSQSSTGYEAVSVFDVPESVSLLVCGANHVVLCQNERLTAYDFTGAVSREWVTSSPIRYVKMLPGVPGSECMLVACQNGQVCKIFLDSVFPIDIIRTNRPIYTVDFDQYREKVLILDDQDLLSIYDVTTQELLFQEPNCTSAVFNTEHEGLMCLTTNDELLIKTQNKITFRQNLKNNQRVVGFAANWVHLLSGTEVETIQGKVPQTGAMYHYMDEEQYQLAYEIACIGVTSSDWNYLGNKTLKKLKLEISAKAFSQTQNYRMLVLINDLMKMRNSGSSDDELTAIIAAYEGDFDKMELHLRRANKLELGVQIYTELRMFDRARTCLNGQTGETQQHLLREQAKWADTGLGDQRAAAEMYLEAGESMKAIEALAQLKSAERLIEVARKLDKGDRKALMRCAELLAELGQTAACGEIYGKIGDWESLLGLYADSNQWEEAFALANRNPDLAQACWTKRADWLAERDMFIEAQQAFHQAGKIEEALTVLEKLTSCAVTENRYNDAAHYYFLLSRQCSDLAQGDKKKYYLELEAKHLSLSECYYAYNFVHRFVEEPFTNILQETLLYASRFLWSRLSTLQVAPPGISKVYVLYAFAKIARQMGCYKTARYCYNQLQSLKIPRGPIWETIQLGSVSIRGKPYRDCEDFNIICPRCGTQNPLAAAESLTACANCQQEYIYSFSNFEPLPLVEFKFEEDITDQEAFGLIDTAGFKGEEKENMESGDNYDRLDFSAPSYEKEMTFEKLMLQSDGDLVLSRDMLRRLAHGEVLVKKHPEPKRWQFFKNVLPSYQLKLDPDSFHFHQAEDWEMLLLQTGQSPFSRRKLADNGPAEDEFDF